MPTVKHCLECGAEFDPGKTRRRYCSSKCQTITITDKVVEYLGSRRCTNCRYTGGGPRFAFWWDTYDRSDTVMARAMLLCSKCWGRFNKVKAHEESLLSAWEQEDEGPLNPLMLL